MALPAHTGAMQAGGQAAAETDAMAAAPSAEQLLGAARGFSRIFWGIGTTLLILSNAVIVGFETYFVVPWHAIGLFLVLAGAGSLRRLQPLTGTWGRWSSLLFAAALLELYFVPFTMWWRALPAVRWYAFNMFLLIGVTLALLLLVNRLVAEAGAALNDRVLVAKGRICEGSVALFILGPALALLFFTLIANLGSDGTPAAVRAPAPAYAWPAWVHFFILVPFLLTMGTAWDGKERCLKELGGQWPGSSGR